MSFFSNIKSLFQKKEILQTNFSPLEISDSALNKIQTHLEKLKFRSIFKIEVVRRKNLYQCNVGFDDSKFYKETKFQYRVKLILSEKDELLLRGSSLEFNEDEQQFYIHPNIEVQIDSIRKNFTRIYINRNFISDSSVYKFIGIEKKQFETLPFYLKKILDLEKISSIYIEKNFISVEHTSNFFEIEEELIDILFDYFSTCAYPILISDNKVELDFEI